MMISLFIIYLFMFFFFNDTATTEIYTLSLHDALPISAVPSTSEHLPRRFPGSALVCQKFEARRDRKSTRLNSSHMSISYADFCFKKKKKKNVLILFIKKKKEKKNKKHNTQA